jgi:hypothetical protein
VLGAAAGLSPKGVDQTDTLPDLGVNQAHTLPVVGQVVARPTGSA